MAVAAQLFRLEQLDAELDQRLAAVNEARRRLQRDPESEAAERRWQEVRAEETAALREQKALEGELADLEGRIKRDHDRLYGGRIVDSRELASLEKEIEHYRGRRDAVEDRLLAAMERAEGLQQTVVALAQQVDTLHARRQTDRPALEQLVSEGGTIIAGLQAERVALAESIDPRALNTYQRLHAASGHAVSRVADGVCQWCRVVIPPKDIQHARAGQLVACSNCARILYVG
jgi:predicted  nucleic acid-binding Zn-ribbon protein